LLGFAWFYSSETDKTVVTRSGPLGLNGVYPEGPSQRGVPIAKGRWLSETSFEIQTRVLGYGVINKWVFEFHGPAIDLHFEDNVGNTAEVLGTMAISKATNVPKAVYGRPSQTRLPGSDQ
jgi:hypothetical protein